MKARTRGLLSLLAAAVMAVSGMCWLMLRSGRPLYYSDGQHLTRADALANSSMLAWQRPEPLLELPGKVVSRVQPLPDGRLVYARDMGTGADLVVFDPAQKQRGAVPLSALNSDAEELSPALRADGALLFASNRGGGAGGFDLYVAAPLGNSFGAPRRLPDRVNTGADETDPAPAADPEMGLVFVRRELDVTTGTGNPYQLLRWPGGQQVDAPAPVMPLFGERDVQALPWLRDVLRDPAFGQDGRSLWFAGQEPGGRRFLAQAFCHDGHFSQPVRMDHLSMDGSLRAPVPMGGDRLLLMETRSGLLYQAMGRMVHPWWDGQQDLERLLLLACSIAALLLVLLLLGRRFTTLDVITWCLLASLLLHLLLYLWLGGVQIVRQFLPPEVGVERLILEIRSTDPLPGTGDGMDGLVARATFAPPAQSIRPMTSATEVPSVASGAVLPEVGTPSWSAQILPVGPMQDLLPRIEQTPVAEDRMAAPVSVLPVTGASPQPVQPRFGSATETVATAVRSGVQIGAVGLAPSALPIPSLPPPGAGRARGEFPVPMPSMEDHGPMSPLPGVVAEAPAHVAPQAAALAMVSPVDHGRTAPAPVAPTAVAPTPAALDPGSAGSGSQAVPPDSRLLVAPGLPPEVVRPRMARTFAVPRPAALESTIELAPIGESTVKSGHVATDAGRNVEAPASRPAVLPPLVQGSPGLSAPTFTPPSSPTAPSTEPALVPAHGFLTAAPEPGHLGNDLPHPDTADTLYQNRFGPRRAAALDEFGGSAATENAVAAGLRYLASIQRPDGSFGDLRRRHEKYGQIVVGRTGLCLLAFLGAGHHPGGTGEHAGVAERAVRFLLSVQRDSGHFGISCAYSHGIATYALAECAGMTGTADLEPAVAKAVAWILSQQNRTRDQRNNGGFGYYSDRLRPEDNFARTAVTAWQVMALESARLAGFEVPQMALDAAQRYLLHSFDPHNGYFLYNREPSRLRSVWRTLPASTPASVFALSLLGTSMDDERMRAGLDFTLDRRPREWRHGSDDEFVLDAVGHVYFWYAGTLAMFMAGGEQWVTWNEALKQILLPAQAEDGSFPPVDVYARYAGDTDRDRAYTTAMCVLSLQVYYRYFTPLLRGR